MRTTTRTPLAAPPRAALATPSPLAVQGRPAGLVKPRQPGAAPTLGCTAHTITHALRNIDQPEALLFDCDGVLVDTEAQGHRPSFNLAFKDAGIPYEWDVPTYGVWLRVGGGKERMTACWNEVKPEWWTAMSEADQKELVGKLHKRKTDLFMELIERGDLPLRPGVARLVNEALSSGVKVAVCSTSNECAVSTIVRVLLGDKVAAAMPVFAGDVVPKKKPDPAIYLLAASQLSVDPARCVVIEDSEIGLAAARAAGMRCVVTESSYTAGENFDGADAVFPEIGNAGAAQFSLDDLTTPGTFWLNPPLPRDAAGNWPAGSAPPGRGAALVDPL